MIIPTMHYHKYVYFGFIIGANMFFYSYNYNILTGNIRFRMLRNFFPLIQLSLFFYAYFDYRNQLLKISMFD